MSFRQSQFINFDTGEVALAPMPLFHSLPPRSAQTLDQMLLAFECRVDVWQLGPATAMLREMEKKDLTPDSVWRHSGYALLAVTFSYFEMIGKILNPGSKKRGSAGPDFDRGFRDVYPKFVGSPDVGQFRDRLRNGIYHLGYTKSNLFIHHQPDKAPDDFMTTVDQGTKLYLVNPHHMTRTIVAHFPTLMTRLRNPAPEFNGLRKKFQEFYDDFHQGA
jgi:hypothetical protein